MGIRIGVWLALAALACTKQPDERFTSPAAGTGSGSAPVGGSEVVDTANYDRTCKTAEECAIVKDDPCNPCSCASTPVAAKESPRFAQAATAITCGRRAKIVCGECRALVASCADGQCVAKPE